MAGISGALGDVLIRALEQSPAIVVITDLKGIIEYVNPRFCNLTGYTRHEVLQKNIRFLKSDEMSAEFYADLWSAIRKKDEWRGELLNRKKSGDLFWESAVISTVRNEEGVAEHYLKVAEDVTRLKEAEEERARLMTEMRNMAMQDALTGLYSRRMFDDELNRAWKTGERHDVTTGLLVVDIDYFKTFNDTYGHQVGDRILVEASDLIRATGRAGDVICRYGGDEIVVILPMASLDATTRVGMRLLEAFRSHRFCKDSHDLRVTASVGVAAGSGNSEPAHEALKRADQALYHAKRHGRNILAVSDPNSTPALTLLGASLPTEGADAPADTVGWEKPGILLLSDDPHTNQTVSATLNQNTFSLSMVRDADSAVRLVKDAPGKTDIILLLGKFRQNDDSDPLKQIWHIDEAVSAIVIVDSPEDPTPVIAPSRDGTVGFIMPPASAEDLLPAIEQAMKQRRHMMEERKYQRDLQHMVSQQNSRLQEVLKSTRERQQPVAEIMTIIFDAYKRKTGEHCRRVEQISRIVASEMQIPEEDREAIERGAFLHDIGKIGIPDSILLKNAPLTLEEWDVVRLHPEVGYDLLKDQPELEDAARIVLEHHERYDGTGYPDGKKGSQICIGARIFAIADTYDAMRAERTYAPSVTPEDAASEIASSRASLFDPDVVDAFLKCQAMIEANVFDKTSHLSS